MKSYIYGIYRGFKSWGYDVDIFHHPIFTCKSNGLIAVLDNKARQLQSTGRHTKSHNVLSREDLMQLYNSTALLKNTPKGFQTRMIFNIGLLTGVRPTELHSIEVTQFQSINLRGESVLKYTGMIGNEDGGSKTARGGWGSIGRRPQEVCVYNESYCNSTLNLYADITQYISIISKFNQKTTKFFLQVNPNATDINNFLNHKTWGKIRSSLSLKTFAHLSTFVVMGTAIILQLMAFAVLWLHYYMKRDILIHLFQCALDIVTQSLSHTTSIYVVEKVRNNNQTFSNLQSGSNAMRRVVIQQ